MNAIISAIPLAIPRPATAETTLRALRDLLPAMAGRAATLDHDGAFPAEDIAALHQTGLLAAPVSLGFGTTPAGAAPLALALRLIGRASLPLGRLYEGHVNALRLVLRYGSPTQVRAATADAEAGRLLAVWNTDAPGETLTVDGTLQGRKVLCSGAGWVSRAVVTARAQPEAPPQMLLLRLPPGERADLMPWTAQGMRASATGTMLLTGSTGEALGEPGDYLRQPEFSAGAWRFAAVHCGGLEALLGGLHDHLRQTGRGADPHQAARLGQAAMASETARLWVTSAASRADTADGAAYANLARLSVERAALDILELVQRSVGLNAFMRPSLLERLSRDLATYLRQPAPDRALMAAAQHVLSADTPPGDLWG